MQKFLRLTTSHGLSEARGKRSNNNQQNIRDVDLKNRFVNFFKYSGKCVHLSWLMSSHSPPLHLDDQPGKDSRKFDHEKFMFYVLTGQVIDYVVWPVLYLQKDGILLAKGVAQPCSKN